MDLSIVQQIIISRSIPEPNSGCWLWVGAVSSNGYGHFFLEEKTVAAHRMSYLAFYGVDPILALHKCNVKSCVNPKHLKSGTAQENARDAIRNGTWNKPKDICKNGHPMTGNNVGCTNLNRRFCVECRRLNALKYSRKHSQGKRRRLAKGELY